MSDKGTVDFARLEGIVEPLIRCGPYHVSAERGRTEYDVLCLGDPHDPARPWSFPIANFKDFHEQLGVDAQPISEVLNALPALMRVAKAAVKWREACDAWDKHGPRPGVDVLLGEARRELEEATAALRVKVPSEGTTL